MIKKFLLLALSFSLCLLTSLTYAEDWMPDENLRQAVRKKLGIPDGIPMVTQDMFRLYDLVSIGEGIRSLRGLEHAVNLSFLHVAPSLVSDLTPLVNLSNLRVLKVYSSEISNITPLINLKKLEVLQLHDNAISDITPLINLKELKTLDLHKNRIQDFSPLLGLTNLELLRTDGIYNILPTCEMPSPMFVRPVKERIADREYPSVFSSHIDIKNRPDLSPLQVLTLSDFSFGYAPFRPAEWPLVFFRTIEGTIQRGGSNLERFESVVSVHREAITANPNMLFLVEITYFDGRHFNLNEDSPHWIRNKDGTRAKRRWAVDHLGKEYWEPLLDFTKPEVQELIIAHAVAVARCGLYDGIWLDRWHRDLRDHFTRETEFSARDKILKGIRSAVRDDFLIIVNTRQKIPRWASWVNGIFVETWPGENREVYTHKDYRGYEESLIWYEKNLRKPQITLLSGEVKRQFNPMSPLARRQMRVFTTLSLTHSDGYVSIRRPVPDADQVWYDFWDAALGRPVGGKATLYDNREGLFIREFDNGWAVYNRSGVPQTIRFNEKVSGVENGITNTIHILDDLDGEIYLKTSLSADVNADGVINILDLVVIANAFGQTSPDVNGDGIVNILDLVAISREIK